MVKSDYGKGGGHGETGESDRGDRRGAASGALSPFVGRESFICRMAPAQHRRIPGGKETEGESAQGKGGLRDELLRCHYRHPVFCRFCGDLPCLESGVSG